MYILYTNRHTCHSSPIAPRTLPSMVTGSTSINRSLVRGLTWFTHMYMYIYKHTHIHIYITDTKRHTCHSSRIAPRPLPALVEYSTNINRSLVRSSSLSSSSPIQIHICTCTNTHTHTHSIHKYTHLPLEPLGLTHRYIYIGLIWLTRGPPTSIVHW